MGILLSDGDVSLTHDFIDSLFSFPVIMSAKQD